MRDKRERNWFWLENSLIDRTDLELVEKMLYIVLARYANNTTSECFPSEDTLIIGTGVKDKRTIRKYIKNLEEKGLIEVVRSKGKSNRYFLKNVEKVVTSDVPTNKKVVASNVTTSDDTSNISCKKVVTFDAKSSDTGCHSNKTITRLNNIMNHEYDFFENLFKQFGVNFTRTNQNSVARLLKTLSKNQVEEYLVETYENLKSNPNIKNLAAAFTKKISTGERQPKFEMKQEVKKDAEIIEMPKEKRVVQKEEKLTVDLIEESKKEKAVLDKIFDSLPESEQKALLEKAHMIARMKNSFEPFAKFLANSKIKYELLKELKGA